MPLSRNSSAESDNSFRFGTVPVKEMPGVLFAASAVKPGWCLVLITSRDSGSWPDVRDVRVVAMDDERATRAQQRRQVVDSHAAALGAAEDGALIAGDGEIMSLAELLERRLDAGVTWP
jgi:hypothetical protein